jgi:hypothetical protein
VNGTLGHERNEVQLEELVAWVRVCTVLFRNPYERRKSESIIILKWILENLLNCSMKALWYGNRVLEAKSLLRPLKKRTITLF